MAFQPQVACSKLSSSRGPLHSTQMHQGPTCTSKSGEPLPCPYDTHRGPCLVTPTVLRKTDASGKALAMALAIELACVVFAMGLLCANTGCAATCKVVDLTAAAANAAQDACVVYKQGSGAPGTLTMYTRTDERSLLRRALVGKTVPLNDCK